MYVAAQIQHPCSASATAGSEGINLVFYAETTGCLSVIAMSDEVAKRLAAELLSAIQEREDAKARRAA